MKILIISDVHSNIHALRAIEAQEGSWDALLFAGDMVDYGLQPHEVVAWMRKYQAIAVAGNHDTALVAAYRQGLTPPDDPLQARSFCEHNLAALTEENVEYIAALPLEATVTLDGITYCITHIYDPQDEEALAHHLMQYHPLTSFERFWAEKVGQTQGKRCLVLGHHHHCMLLRMLLQLNADTYIINPGAAGYKLGIDVGTKGASYIVMEDGIPYFRWAEVDLSDDYRIVSEQMNQLEKGQRDSGLAIFGV